MMKMANCIAGIQYLPSVEYFAHWAYHGTLLLEINENYPKRAWRNKTFVLGPHHAVPLSVPLRKGKNHQMLITNVEISYDESWTNIHMNCIRTAYGKTAFFNEFEDAIFTIYQSFPKYLWDLNLQFIQFIISFFQGKWNIEYTQTYEPLIPESFIDLRKGVPAGQSSLLNSTLQYEQIHRLTNSFLPNLSILDVLCHLGPGTYAYLKQYAGELYR